MTTPYLEERRRIACEKRVAMEKGVGSAARSAAMDALLALSPEERDRVLDWFCTECHRYVPPEDLRLCPCGGNWMPLEP